MPGGALGPLLFFLWVSVTWSPNACFTHHKPQENQLDQSSGGRAEQGIQMSLFCPEVAALPCPPHQPDKPTDLWLPGTPGGAGSWFGMSLRGGCVVASHEDKGGSSCEDVIEADGFGVAHMGMTGLQEGHRSCHSRHNQVWHCPTCVRNVPAPLMGQCMFSSESVTLMMVWIPR